MPRPPLPIHLLVVLLVALAGIVSAGAQAAGRERPVVASCPDGSVIFAAKWSDVRCEGAIRWSPGSTPRVGPQHYRAALRARQQEHLRERWLEQQLDAAQR